MAEQDIGTIERRRKALQISKTQLCSSAGVAQRGYDYALSGLRNPKDATLAKLNMALKRFQIGFAGEASRIAPHAAFRACVLLVAFATGADARAALNADPARRATADPAWLAAAKTRRIAFSIANQWLGFSISDVARAAGVTKAAVSAAIRELEDTRDDDADLDRLLNSIEDILA